MKNLNRILVDIDARAPHQPALDRAVAIARVTGAEVTVVCVATSRDVATGAGARNDDEAVDALKQRLHAVAADASGVRVSSRLLFGRPAEALTEEVDRWGADLLVRSHTRDMALPDKSFGGIDRDLVRTCCAPVLLVGPGAAPEHPRVLGTIAPDDGWRDVAPLNRVVIEYTLTMAAVESGSASLLQAWTPFVIGGFPDAEVDADIAGYVEQRRAHIVARLVETIQDAGVDPEQLELTAQRGLIDDVLTEFVVSHGVDLVVIGVPRRRGPARWLLGSTAERLLAHLTCSVLAIKADQTTR